jgi:hypothetical protein
MKMKVESIEELRSALDADILAIIAGKIKDAEEAGYPTETVIIPTKKANTLIYKVKKLIPQYTMANLDAAQLKFDPPTLLKREKAAREIANLQKQIKELSFEVILRSLPSEEYERAFTAQNDDLSDTERLKQVLYAILPTSILGYTYNGLFTDFSTLSDDEKEKFIKDFDTKQQLPLFMNAINQLVITSNDFETAMQDLDF